MTPTVVRFAGCLVALEGVGGLVVAAIYLYHRLTGANQNVVRGLPAATGFSYGTAAWFAIMGAGIVAAGWALTAGRRWGRGIAIFANLLLLGVAYYVYSSGQTVYAVVVAAVALMTLGLLFSPPAVQWMTRTRNDR